MEHRKSRSAIIPWADIGWELREESASGTGSLSLHPSRGRELSRSGRPLIFRALENKCTRSCSILNQAAALRGLERETLEPTLERLSEIWMLLVWSRGAGKWSLNDPDREKQVVQIYHSYIYHLGITRIRNRIIIKVNSWIVMQSTRLLISPLENDYAANKIVIKYTKVE